MTAVRLQEALTKAFRMGAASIRCPDVAAQISADFSGLVLDEVAALNATQAPAEKDEPISKQYLREQVARQMASVHEALGKPQPQSKAAEGDWWLMTADDDDGSADWVERGKPAPAPGFRAVRLVPADVQPKHTAADEHSQLKAAISGAASRVPWICPVCQLNRVECGGHAVPLVSQAPAPGAELTAEAQRSRLETLMTDLADAVFYRNVDKIPGIRKAILAAATQAPAVAHPDDAAVDALASAMKAKLADAREKGRSGWQTCPPEELSLMLREHVEKGDPRDVANFCAFLWALGQGIALPPVGTDNFDLWVSRGMGAKRAAAPDDAELERLFCERVGLDAINPEAVDTRRSCLWFAKGYRAALSQPPVQGSGS